MSFWLWGWAAGEHFALSELPGGGFRVTDLFLLIWVNPWSLAGAAVACGIAWRLFGTERLYFTSNALVCEWGILETGGRRADGSAIFDAQSEALGEA